MLKMFKNLKKRDYILIAISIIFIVSQVWLDLRLPEYMSKITTLVQTEGSQMSEILTQGRIHASLCIGKFCSSSNCWILCC